MNVKEQMLQRAREQGFAAGRLVGLEEAAEVCEAVTHWGLSRTKAEVARSTQAFCAKAIRAQTAADGIRRTSDEPEAVK